MANTKIADGHMDSFTESLWPNTWQITEDKSSLQSFLFFLRSILTTAQTVWKICLRQRLKLKRTGKNHNRCLDPEYFYFALDF